MKNKLLLMTSLLVAITLLVLLGLRPAQATTTAQYIILFQGDEDKIVPPSQSEMMYEAVREREIPVAYLLFKGEQHGFRKAENIKRALEAELYFFSRVFKFALAEDIEPVEIEKL